MRTLCPNMDGFDGLETVLEVPIPEETFDDNQKINASWKNMRSWIKQNGDKSPKSPPPTPLGCRNNSDIQLLLSVAGAPLIPLPVHTDHTMTRNIKDHPIEGAKAKYIVQQYLAACGGENTLNRIDSMYAMGKVKMATSESVGGDGKMMKSKSIKNGGGETGGFVLWQKRPDLWCLELLVSGYKISAGSDGKVAWRQTPWHNPHAARGPPRPLRRSLQGLDPKNTANLFSNSTCVGEKTVNNEDCFVLKLQANKSSLRERSSGNVDIIQHTIWGYFSQKTGLLVKLEDSHLLRIKPKIPENDSVLWETTMESLIQDYRTIDGVNIAHAGKTSVSLFRFSENFEVSHSKTRMEEVWTIEDVDFNIKGLSMDCFLPPGDLKKEDDGSYGIVAKTLPQFKVRSNSTKFGSMVKVVAVDEEAECHN